MPDLSIVIPCKNEQSSIAKLVDDIRSLELDLEIIIVNDGSTDDTAAILAQLSDIKVHTSL